MKILFMVLVLVLAFVAYACANPWKFVFTNGHALAVQQDSLLEKIKAGEKIDRKTIRELRINWWVSTAYRTAPGNLVVRQYCIIDLARDKKRPRYRRRIEKMVDTLSVYDKNSKYRTWAESYSYWLYTNNALSLWVEKYDKGSLQEASNQIDSGFAYTSYRRPDGLFYPAPFGDLRDAPLDMEGQNLARHITNPLFDAKMQNVIRNPVLGTDDLEYHIKAMPLGFNNHCEAGDTHYKVINGFVKGFKWYEGYDKKYKDKEAEILDILDIRRLVTIPFIW